MCSALTDINPEEIGKVKKLSNVYSFLVYSFGVRLKSKLKKNNNNLDLFSRDSFISLSRRTAVYYSFLLRSIKVCCK